MKYICDYNIKWDCAFAPKERELPKCELCLKAKEKFPIIDSYLKSIEHFEESFWERIMEEIERRVKLEVEKIYAVETPHA